MSRVAFKRSLRRPPRLALPSKETPHCLGAHAPGNHSTGEIRADVRYSQDSQILLLGEANFTFAAAICKRFEDCSGLTATSYESREEILDRFGGAAARRLAGLEQRLCGVHHSLSVGDMPTRFRQNSFDCVAFNFPLVAPAEPGSGSQREQQHATTLRRTYRDLSELLVDFFSGVSHVLRPGGECHLRMTDQHLTSRGLRAAQPFGLELHARLDFHVAFEEIWYPLGYRPVTVVAPGGSRRASTKSGFDVQHSSTFVFRRSADLQNSVGSQE
eukprot:TRINITY_DN59231_c0_g1_i1.p1 TRINITY_DN59231_c0_g1~~TRINITY_DN59231_c0_g1_i1.p1  ORF type:complete len:272 (-),score=33.82 TRINITY_DN59231_c0_g1_i1:77-892(-)